MVLCLLLCIILSGCRTRSYSPEKAAKNGEIVFGYDFYNTEKLDKFIENVNNNVPDKIKITNYGQEGMFLIETITYDGKKIKAVFDSTMEFHKHERRKEKGEYTSIIKEVSKFNNGLRICDIIVYYLINDKEKREMFAMPGVSN